MKTTLLAALFIFLNTASADTTAAVTNRYSTQTYVGTILSSEGNQPHAFPAGARVIVTTALDRRATDVVSLPMFGYYPEGLQALTIEVPDTGFLTRNGPGVLDIANNQEDGLSIWDYFHVHANTLDAGSGYIDGYPVNTGMFELWRILPLGGSPTMLDSDAVPIRPLVGATYAVFEVWTAIGYTYVRIELTPLQPSVQELVRDAEERIQELVAGGRLNQGIAASLVAKSEAILRAYDRSNAACGPLAGLRNQVGNLPRRTPDESEVLDELQAMVAELDDALDQCP